MLNSETVHVGQMIGQRYQDVCRQLEELKTTNAPFKERKRVKDARDEMLARHIVGPLETILANGQARIKVKSGDKEETIIVKRLNGVEQSCWLDCEGEKEISLAETEGADDEFGGQPDNRPADRPRVKFKVFGIVDITPAR